LIAEIRGDLIVRVRRDEGFAKTHNKQENGTKRRKHKLTQKKTKMKRKAS
jgi:hypothetical protein